MNLETVLNTKSSEKTIISSRSIERRRFSPDEKIRIVLTGLRGDISIAELCRAEGIGRSLYYFWSKDFLEGGEKRLAGMRVKAVAGDVVPDSSLMTSNLNMPVADFNRLIQAIYQGPLESPPWRTFVKMLNSLLGAMSTTLIIRPAAPDRASLMVSEGPTEARFFALYNSRFFELDVFCNLPPDQVLVAADIIGEAKWLESVFYLEYLKPQGVRHIMGADLSSDSEEEECRLRVARSEAQFPFGEREKSITQMLLPHLKQAVRLRSHLQHLDTERKLYAGTVDRMRIGMLTLDEKGLIHSINEQANVILAEQDGISVIGKTLRAGYPTEQRKLKAVIDAAYASMQPKTSKQANAPTLIEAISITRPSGGSKLSLLVRTLPKDRWSGSSHHPCVAIFLRDPQRGTQGSNEVIRRLFDLTRSEARLALLLANGVSLDEASEQLNIRRNTVRAHLRTIFSKMGVTRRTELVLMVMNSVVQLG